MRKAAVNPLEDLLRERVDAALAELPYARRVLFGLPCFYAGPHLFAFIWEGERLGLAFTDDEDAEALRSLPGAEPWFPSRRHGAVPKAVLLPEELVEDEEALAHWIQRAHAQAITAPARPSRR